jgi:hypothetical protein
VPPARTPSGPLRTRVGGWGAPKEFKKPKSGWLMWIGCPLVAGPRRASLAECRTECFGFLFGTRWPVLRLFGPPRGPLGSYLLRSPDLPVELLSVLLLAPAAWRLGSVGER